METALRYEAELREQAERRIKELEELIPKKRTRRTKAEMEVLRQQKPEYSEFKSNGVKKKQKTVSIKSYTDFKKIQDYFLEKNQIRNYMLWTIGVSLGVRASDLAPLKWKNLLDKSFQFRERIFMYEKKTSKLQNCLITPAIKEAAVKFLNSICWEIELDTPIFLNSVSGEPITEKQCWKILKKASKAVGIEYNIGTHSMRNSFANIALCVDKHSIDMNAITKIQGLLNHSDPKCTMRYLGTMDDMYDKARLAVSDFVLGKTDVDELIAGEATNLDTIMEKLQALEDKVVQSNAVKE